jgi:hypothetical protein
MVHNFNYFNHQFSVTFPFSCEIANYDYNQESYFGSTANFKQREAPMCKAPLIMCRLVADLGNSHSKIPLHNVSFACKWRRGRCLLQACLKNERAWASPWRNAKIPAAGRHPSGGRRTAGKTHVLPADLSIANSFLAACEKDPLTLSLAARYCGGSIGLPLLNPPSQPGSSHLSLLNRRRAGAFH